MAFGESRSITVLRILKGALRTAIGYRNDGMNFVGIDDRALTVAEQNFLTRYGQPCFSVLNGKNFKVIMIVG